MNIEAIKAQIRIAINAVNDVPESLRVEAFGVVLKQLLEELRETEKAPVGQALVVGESSYEQPPSISGTSSCREAIAKLFASDWGRRPRSLREIADAMKLNAIYYSDQAVATELRRMTKLGLLRRFKEGKNYTYVSAKPIST